MSLEKYLIVHCAPTLASLKTASLFSLRYSSKRELEEQLESWNRRLEEKGIFLLELRRTEQKALVYVCRKSHLCADLKKPGVARFLSGCGYACAAPAEKAAGRGKGMSPRDRDFPGVSFGRCHRLHP